jgi:hypothetical protein
MLGNRTDGVCAVLDQPKEVSLANKDGNTF